MAVIDPLDPERYALGILLDGNSYASTETVHDREISNPAVLKGLGWHVLRVYAIDWWEDASRELARIIAAIESDGDPDQGQERMPESSEAAFSRDTPTLLKAPQSASISLERFTRVINAQTRPEASVEAQRSLVADPTVFPAIPPQSSEVVSTGDRNGAIPYIVADLPITILTAEQFLLVRDSYIARHCMAVIDAEAPITESLLIRRVLAAFGISRAGSRMRAKVLAALRRVQANRIVDNGVAVYFSGSTAEYEGYRTTTTPSTQREARELPIVEVANAANAVLMQQFGMPEEVLIRETAKLFGFSRTGATVQETMQKGISRLIQGGRAIRDAAGVIRLPVK